LSSSDSFVRVAAWIVPASDYAEAKFAGELSDEDLMSRVKNGDQASFAILMRRHARVVLAVGRVSGRTQADDVVAIPGAGRASGRRT